MAKESMTEEKQKVQFTKEAVIGELKEINKSMEEDIEFYMGQIGSRLDENYNEDLDECVSIWMHHQWDLEDFIKELEGAEFDEGCKVYDYYDEDDYDLEDEEDELDLEEEYQEYERDFAKNLDNWAKALGIVEVSQEEFLEKYFKLIPTGIVREYTEYREKNPEEYSSHTYRAEYPSYIQFARIDLDFVPIEGFPRFLLIDNEGEEDEFKYYLYSNGDCFRILRFMSRGDAITFVRHYIASYV